MQDPSFGVAPPLQNHVHLISGHRFPMLTSLNLEQAFRYLLDAPIIVKKTAAMSWTYVQAPQDGTVWLEWIAPRSDNRFPSDGYVWGDPESTYRQEFGGYTIELMVHMIGYNPGQDHHATHARTRYHLIAKNPAVNAAAPDPSLWIVHYHRTDPSRVMPSAQVPVNPAVAQLLHERKALEARGRIDRRDFMLHDREHWPTITIPGGHMQPQGYYGGQNMGMPQNRFPQMPGYQQAAGPPAKRPRYSGPGAVPGVPDGPPDTSIEDEENVALGDFFDHLTPREISLARYKQHHDWIEEVFSSPYASSHIVPPDLGLGLMGELKGLTDGIVDTPSLDDVARHGPQAARAKESQPFANLKKEQLEEFDRRIEKHLEEGKAEIERIEAEHAAKMAQWKKTKDIMQAEKRLRYATWEDDEGASAAHLVDVPETNGKADGATAPEKIEDVIKDVESLVKKKISLRHDAEIIQKGGYEKSVVEEQPDDMMGDGSSDPLFQQTSSNMDGGVQGQSTGSRPLLSTQPAPAASGNPAQLPAQTAQGLNNAVATDLGDTSMMGDMDLDVDGGIDIEGVDFGEDEGDADAQTANNLPQTAAPVPQPTGSSTTVVDSAPAAPAPSQQPGLAAPVTGAVAHEAGAAAPGGIAGTASEAFDDSAFADLADMDGGGDDDDGLIDFDGGMGMDDSAFGDAMHGMEDADPSSGDGAGAAGGA